MSDLPRNAVAIADLVRRREVSAAAVVDEAIGRVEAGNDALNAFVFTAFDEARERAAGIDAALARGEDVGILAGVPTAMKDLFDFKPGWPSTFGGIRALKDLSIPAWCGWAERTERAGGIILGKTNSPVMGFRGVCDNPLFGPSRNPFDRARNTGGSSGGSAAAVAAGLVPFAEGTDGGGSIRIPASWCGCFGYKPAFGRVPFLLRPNGFGSTAPFLYEGPIARTVEDGALNMAAISGHDPRDPFSVEAVPDYLGAARRGREQGLEGVRIAYTPDYGIYPVDRRVAAAVRDGLAALRDAGAIVEEVELVLPHDQMALSDLWCRMIMPINVAGLEGLKAAGIDLMADPGELPPRYRAWVERCHDATGLDIAADHVMRTEVLDAVNAVFEGYDLLVSPTVTALPVLNADDGDTIGPTEVEGVEVDPLIGWCPTYVFNYMGNPAATVPIGLADGLPVGLHIAGRRWDDEGVFAASAAVERVRPWAAMYERLDG